ncbi:MAG: phage holin family protein [Rhodoferax sp.]
MRQPGKSVGFFASLRRLLGTVLEIAHVRLELLGIELELEKRRLLDALLLGLLALLMAGVGLVLLCGFIILLFWEGYRLAAVGVMMLLVLLSAA